MEEGEVVVGAEGKSRASVIERDRIPGKDF
jgi:hypothetical protein